jgi:hypothetical protein
MLYIGLTSRGVLGVKDCIVVAPGRLPIRGLRYGRVRFILTPLRPLTVCALNRPIGDMINFRAIFFLNR